MRFITIASVITLICVLESKCMMAKPKPVDDTTLVLTYLLDYKYLSSSTTTKHEIRKALRNFQRENDIKVTGRISPTEIKIVKEANTKIMVIKYLKNFGYLEGDVNPLKIMESIKKLQKDSGILEISGKIDEPTVQFINDNQHGCSGGLID